MWECALQHGGPEHGDAQHTDPEHGHTKVFHIYCPSCMRLHKLISLVGGGGVNECCVESDLVLVLQHGGPEHGDSQHTDPEHGNTKVFHIC